MPQDRQQELNFDPGMFGGQPPLAHEEIVRRLVPAVDMVLSIRRSVEQPARELADFDRIRQEQFIAAVEHISLQTVELAYNFCVFGTAALPILDLDEWDGWVRHLLDAYDEGGVIAAIRAMQQAQDYASALREVRSGAVELVHVVGVLEHFVTGLGGRALRVAPSDRVYTDTETLFLPESVGCFQSATDNYRLYRAMAVHLWAQCWFGTWRAPWPAVLAEFPDRGRAVRVVHALETLRLDGCIARELPGLHRDNTRLRRRQDSPGATDPEWDAAARQLAAPGSTVQDSIHLLPGLYELGRVPEPEPYQGILLPELAAAVIEMRRQRDREHLGVLLRDILLESSPVTGKPPRTTSLPEPAGFSTQAYPDPDAPGGLRFELRLQGEAVRPHQEVRQTLDSIVQDLGSIPEEYLVPAGHGKYRRGPVPPDEEGEDDLRGGHTYDEWDYLRRHYRKGWCFLHERDVHPYQDDFVPRTLHKHRGLLKQLHRTFEALRGEEKVLRRQPHGDGIDIDAAVEAFADTRVGREADDRLFTRRRRVERDIAVMFLVDMSGSTKGWINEVEREALVLLCESLEILGDRYAIYGFSGFTHKRCELFRIKRLEEPYDDEVKARISGVKPQDYTRMGVAIRHLTRLFQGVEARTRLLITLSDGRPDDQDGYRGTYGIEDTRKALMEARYQGIHPYCITIDDEAMEYLPHMYGMVGFTVVDEVHKLPYKVSDIYRRITA